MRKFIILMGAALFTFLQACDKCKDVECKNGGTCKEGTCTCPTGFSGANCETEDKCITKNPNCKNGAPCNDGVCACVQGYEGADCGVEQRTKFLGNYLMSGSIPALCPWMDTVFNDTLSLKPASGAQPQLFFIDDTGFMGTSALYVATGGGNTFSNANMITGWDDNNDGDYNDVNDWYATVNGSLSGNNLTLTINKTVNDPGGTFTCTYNFTGSKL